MVSEVCLVTNEGMPVDDVVSTEFLTRRSPGEWERQLREVSCKTFRDPFGDGF